MMDPRRLAIKEYDYSLPPEKIAAFPKEERDLSRLLIYNQTIQEDVFRNLSGHLPANSLIVFNNTRVVEARLLFYKPTGAAIEIFCLEPDDRYPDITSALAEKKHVYWKCLVGNASAWTPGLTLKKETSGDTLSAVMIAKKNDHFILQLSWNNEETTFSEMLHLAGAVPLPPYIKRKASPLDAVSYQTIYAETPGSVAAPTAGLHFTTKVMHDLSSRNISTGYVTLHVGAGTFKPVKSDTIADHDMHSELIEVKRSFIEELMQYATKTVIAVGTTSLRTLESLYWIGVKLHRDPDAFSNQPELGQWEPYELENSVDPAVALQAIINWLEKNKLNVLIARTAVLIAPSYQFKIVKVLITNFHQPKSTLLLLVAAFIGDNWKNAYAYALANNFRFLSYGDSCLFFRQAPSP